jgi:hypothetical protein
MYLANRSLNTVIFLAVIIAFSSVLAGDAVSVKVKADDGEKIVLHYEFGTYESQDVEIDGREFQEIWFPSEPVFLEKGAPALPHLNRSLIIPDDARMVVKVLDSEYRDIFASVAPSKGNLTRKVDPETVPYEFGPAYDSDIFYPGEIARLHSPYILRDFRGMVVQVNPFQYNPVTRVLRIYTEMTIEVSSTGPGRVNVLDRKAGASKSGKSFKDLYDPHFLNFTARSGDKDFDQEGEMLIIAHDPWTDNMAPFVAHKALIGINATVVGISTVGNTTNAIASYIQNAYDTSDLAYVLLVGDIAQIDSPDVYAGEDGASDPSYSKLAGSDNYPDILIGRFSAGTAAQVDTQVERSIHYETLPATTQDWFWRGVGIASNEGAGQGDEGQSDIAHQTQIRSWLMGAGYTEVDQLYDPGATSSQVTAALNEGRGVVNYTGHGWSGGWASTGFDTGNVNNLTNNGKLPFIVSVACNNGEFENFTSCYGEAWMRATHNNAPAGAVAIYASSVSQYWAPPMEGQDEFNLLLVDPTVPYHTFGALCFGGSISMMDDYGVDGVDMFNTWIVFGDPSLQVVGVPIPPTGLRVEPNAVASVEGPAGGPHSPNTFQYTLTNQDEEPLEYSVEPVVAWLTVDKPAGTIPAGGSELVTVTLNDHSCNLDNGFWDGEIEFTNMSRHEGDTARTVDLMVGSQVLQQSWELDSDPGWFADGEWEYGAPSGLGGDYFGNPDPSSAASGTNIFGVNLDGDFRPLPGGPYYLTTNPVDLTGGPFATLKFKRWLNTKENPPVEAKLELSTDGSSWTELWVNGGNEVTDDSWIDQAFDISALAANQPSVSLRWSYNVSVMTQKCSGWNIDDIQFWSVPESIRIDLQVGKDQLVWSPVQGVSSYDVVRGDLMLLNASGGDFTLATDVCLSDNLSDLSLDYSDEPGPGEGRWFLVRAVTETGAFTYQTLAGVQGDLRDEEINAASGSCP